MKQNNDKGEKKKGRKLTRQKILILVDVLLLIPFIGLWFYDSLAVRRMDPWYMFPTYLLVYGAFIAVSFIIYYLAIMASALGKAYLDKEKEENEEQK